MPDNYERLCRMCPSSESDRIADRLARPSLCVLLGSQSRRQVLRTVYLPNERADALIRAVSELHDRFEEFKLISTEQIQVQT